MFGDKARYQNALTALLAHAEFPAVSAFTIVPQDRRTLAHRQCHRMEVADTQLYGSARSYTGSGKIPPPLLDRALVTCPNAGIL
ncbi:hypothetical protein Pres01_23790 [Metapseudomonas resinovorans]|nr:hypothetical protein Pres01_23790 [Pseudomonas resinovorans]